MTNYICPNARREARTPLLQCARTGKPCVNQRYCTKRKETVLTAYAKDCPGRTKERIATASGLAMTESEKPKKKAAAKKTKANEKAD